MFKFLLPLFLVGSMAFADVSVPRAKQYAWTTYDVAVNGGASVPHSLGMKLPAGSIITDAWVYINTAFTNSGTASLGFQCAGTLDIMAYNDASTFKKDYALQAHLGGGTQYATTVGALFNNVAQVTNGAALNAGYGSVPTACDFQAVVRGDSGYSPYTAGKATVIVEYFRLQ